MATSAYDTTDDTTCAICLQLLYDPVKTACGRALHGGRSICAHRARSCVAAVAPHPALAPPESPLHRLLLLVVLGAPHGDGHVVAGNKLVVDNLELDANKLVATGTGDIELIPGTGGKVVLGSIVEVDNLQLDGQTIKTTNADGDLNLVPHGTGRVFLDAETRVGTLSP